MDGIALRHWPKALGAVLGLLMLLSLFSFHLQDPSLTNLRLPSGGIANWLGLPGALLGGSLLELLGTSALAAPLLWLNWVWCARNRPVLPRYAFWSACVLLALSGLHGLAAPPPGSPEPGLLDAGLAGWAVRHWSGLSAGPWTGAALLAYVGLFAANRVVYAPAARTAAREARLVIGWLLRQGWRRSTASAVEMRRRAALLRRVSGATAMGLTRRTGLGLRGLLRGLLHLAVLPPRMAAGWLAELRMPSLAGIKARSVDPSAAVGGRRAGIGASGSGFSGSGFGAGGSERAGAGADSFDDWLRTPEPLPDAAAVMTPGRARVAARDEGSVDPGGAPDPESQPHPPPERVPAPLPPWRRRPPVLQDALEALAPPADPEDGAAGPPTTRTAESAPGAEQPVPSLEPLGTTDYAFERSEAEAAWRQRFQRYARNLDLDWEEQLGGRSESGAGALAHPGADDTAVDAAADDDAAGDDAADDDAAGDDAASRDAER